LPPTFVARFDNRDVDPALLGGKGAGLSQLVGLGHRVPAGCTLTSEAFRAALEAMGLVSAWEELRLALADGGDVIAAGARVRAGLENARIPSHVFEPLLVEIDALRLFERFGHGAIVRSSATVEDSSAHSFAGIFESIRVEEVAELEPTIRAVWASAFSRRAVSYMKESGVHEAPSVAVVVQAYVDPPRSGVMFTSFPGPDGIPKILIEHVEGSCEKLVLGEVTPDRLWLGGAEEVPDDLAGSLSSTLARELCIVAGELERAFGGPQDVEWLIHDDVVHLVQSRPVTTGFVPREPSMAAGGESPILTGVAASPGTASGAVHMAFNIDQALQLVPGDVLVTPMTNPDMVVAMRNSAAIVTDVGGVICHAAIVSRELGLPCVVGTERATTLLQSGMGITVDGSAGVVYAGLLTAEVPPAPSPTVGWTDLWRLWSEVTAGRADLVPIVSTLDAMRAIPHEVGDVVLIPDLDLRCDPQGLWSDLEGMEESDRTSAVEGFVAAAAGLDAAGPSRRILLLPLSASLVDDLRAATNRVGEGRVLVMSREPAGGDDPHIVASTGDRLPHRSDRRTAIPLGAVAAIRAAPDPRTGGTDPGIGGPERALLSALDTVRFFGHKPASATASMPAPEHRRRWWNLLPEYARYHQEFDTPSTSGEFEWLQIRPELVISPMLKSLVQPGFEMIPRVMGFSGLPPMHVKWIRCRYHFRADTFATVWEAIVRATWHEGYMADLMRRVRASYRYLEEVLELFPATEKEMRAIDGSRMVALITSWWPRWVEFFALCWFIQAQGDDVAYPFVDETVRDNLSRVEPPPDALAWPISADLVAPTTSVMSGAYMASVGRLREALLAAGLDRTDHAVATVERGREPDIRRMLDEHLRAWGWMRDRDLLFEPWDTPARVIDTALNTESHAVVPYEENLRRNRLALSFHMDLAHVRGRAAALNRHARFLHDLNVERENHHVLWLKYSYPLRRLCLEINRRLVDAGSLEPGEVFFLQAPELIDAARALPAPLPPAVRERVRNRRAGFRLEARLDSSGEPAPVEEDDYY
jgi:phosphohistidine swiveling domain-containing protein